LMTMMEVCSSGLAHQQRRARQRRGRRHRGD
jgi:hypothetical protein